MVRGMGYDGGTMSAKKMLHYAWDIQPRLFTVCGLVSVGSIEQTKDRETAVQLQVVRLRCVLVRVWMPTAIIIINNSNPNPSTVLVPAQQRAVTD